RARSSGGCSNRRRPWFDRDARAGRVDQRRALHKPATGRRLSRPRPAPSRSGVSRVSRRPLRRAGPARWRDSAIVAPWLVALEIENATLGLRHAWVAGGGALV